MILVRYGGRPVACVTRRGARLFPWVAALEIDHPVRRWIACLTFFAGDVLDGRLRGPYTDRRAAHFGRCALLPDGEFAAVEASLDAVLAEHFNVPLEQIGEKRRDLFATASGLGSKGGLA